MALLGLFRKKHATSVQKLIQPRERQPLNLSAETPAHILKTTRPALPAKSDKDWAGIPAGIDFSSLWEEPQDPSMITTIVSAASAILSLITLIVLIIKN